MARKTRTPSEPVTNPADLTLAPTQITKQEFGRRLYRLMRDRNWNQSDLARAAFGTIEDAQGRTVARRRDSVSTYLRGRSVPDPRSLEALAKALDVKIDDLWPNQSMAGIDAETPALLIHQAVGHPEKVWLRVNQLCTLDQALAVAGILRGTAAPTGG